MTDATIEVGMAREAVLVRELSRGHIAQYSGASGDFNPLHVDERFATEAGHPSIFAHGMLTMGLTGKILTDWFGPTSLVNFSARFLERVWPGDTLVGRVVVDGLDPTPDGVVARLVIETTNQDQKVVLSGQATARVG